ncbi:histidinol phosphatase [hydrocarbon metagenome]|uniref:Histidinol phosphatase n=1 Tax=hydrocarbon metagenome TaxID=938273 RepID=A0A0W8E608_9ZZZZ
MKFYGDYHTHSRYSDGRQSVQDIVNAAVDKGLREVAITDHGPLAAVIGVKSADDYSRIRQEIEALPDQQSDITILLGAEANIRDLDGTLDIDADLIEELDILIAGLHPYTLPTTVKDGWNIMVQNSLRHLGRSFRDKAVTANTKAVVEVIYQNPELDILSHPGLFFKVDVEEVARACARNDVLFEINCGHKHPQISDIIEAERVGVDFIINSDSHFTATVGNLDYGSWVVDRLGIDEGTIANNRSGGGFKKWSKKAKYYAYS